MVTDQLLTFIKSQLSLGVSKDAIVQMLSSQGWSSLDIQQAFVAVNPTSVPPPISPSAPISPVPPASQSAVPGAGFSMDSLQKNKKFMATITNFAIYGTILYVVEMIVGMIVSAMHFSAYYSVFSAGALVSAIIFGVIGMAIGGAIFYFLYGPIHDWVKRTPFLSRYIHDMFTLFWKPYLVIAIIMAAFGLLGMLGFGATMVAVTGGYAAVGFGGLFIGWIINLVVQIAVYYWYAKTISAKLSPYYPW
jgi:hypothetical protein